jgi:hypothetical protein
MRRTSGKCTVEKWDGQAGARIVDLLVRAVSGQKCGESFSRFVVA